jgi:hypothetical protein
MGVQQMYQRKWRRFRLIVMLWVKNDLNFKPVTLQQDDYPIRRVAWKISVATGRVQRAREYGGSCRAIRAGHCSVSHASGVHDLFITFAGGEGADLMNFDWFQRRPTATN